MTERSAEAPPKEPNPDGPRTYDPEETAKRVGCAALTLKRKAAKGIIPSTMIFGNLRFSDDDITTIIQMGSRPAGPRRARRKRPVR